jgi:hypothetical protein
MRRVYLALLTRAGGTADKDLFHLWLQAHVGWTQTEVYNIYVNLAQVDLVLNWGDDIKVNKKLVNTQRTEHWLEEVAAINRAAEDITRADVLGRTRL